METAVIILNYNGKSCLPECIDTLLKSHYQNFSVILVDNASHDSSLEDAQKRFRKEIKEKKIKVVKCETNTGFAEGNNIGYRHVDDKVKYVALLNYDSIIPEDWLDKLISSMKRHTEAAIVGSTVVNLEQQGNIDKIMKEANECSVTLNMELANRAPKKMHKGMSFFHLYVSGNGMLVRKSMFATLFNPDYFAYAEDIDICWNARMRGLQVILQRDAILLHKGSVAKKKNPGVRPIAIFNGTKNQIVNYLAHWEIKNIIRILPLFIMNQLAQIAYDPRRLIVKLKAYFWTLTNIGRILAYRKKVQSWRKVKDKELIKELSGILHNSGIVSQGIMRHSLNIVNKACLLYCRMVLLDVVEFQKK